MRMEERKETGSSNAPTVCSRCHLVIVYEVAAFIALISYSEECLWFENKCNILLKVRLLTLTYSFDQKYTSLKTYNYQQYTLLAQLNLALKMTELFFRGNMPSVVIIL